MSCCRRDRRLPRSRFRPGTEPRQAAVRLQRGAAALAAALVLAASLAAGGEPRTTNDAVYTKQQAKAGERLYREHCLQCHDQRYFRPVLAAWEGEPLGLLYQVMSASMPESNPGALPRSEYADILAYILSLSRYPAGDAALDYRNGALDEILIAPVTKD